MELETRQEKVIHIEDFFAMETDIVVDNFGKLDEPAMIKAICSLQADIVHVSSEVVKLVGIDASLSISHNVIQEDRNQRLCMATRLFGACHEVSYMRNIRSVDINLKLIDEVFEKHDRPGLMVHEWIVACSGTVCNSWQKVVIKQMRVRAVAEVMAQTSQFDELHGMPKLTLVIIGQACSRVAWIVVECMNKGTRQMRDAQTVFKAIVRGTGVDEIGAAELFEVAESL